MALDEPKNDDEIFDEDNLKFLVESSLLKACGSIKVDFIDAGARSGFTISSSIPLGGGSACGSCGSSCGT